MSQPRNNAEELALELAFAKRTIVKLKRDIQALEAELTRMIKLHGRPDRPARKVNVVEAPKLVARIWCGQCDANVTLAKANQCQSKFCKVRPRLGVAG